MENNKEINSSYNLEVLHQELLELMNFVHKFCIENNIKYSLTGGSLLGAIRHNGFIPWDDDFDIMFDRRNYEKFITCMKNTNNIPFVLEQEQWVYRVRKCHKEKKYIPSIDLFVMDYIPENKITYQFQMIMLKILQGMLRENVISRKYSLFYTACIKLTGWLGFFLKKEKLFDRYDKLSQIGNKNDKNKMGIFNDKFRLIGYQYSNSIMNDYELHQFEDQEYSIISGYDEYLLKQYGDYMKLPSEKERMPIHII